jgi:hypothetical protein
VRQMASHKANKNKNNNNNNRTKQIGSTTLSRVTMGNHADCTHGGGLGLGLVFSCFFRKKVTPAFIESETLYRLTGKS